MAAAAIGLILGVAREASAETLLNVSYDPTRELYRDLNEAFITKWTADGNEAPTLEQSLALWTRGEALAARCEEWLVGAKRLLDAARPAEDDA